MKSITILALVAGAQATFRGAGSFNCPTNTDNQCDDRQSSGFDWSDAPVGVVKKYGRFDLNGWTCEDGGKRDRLGRRTGGKHLSGNCGSTKQQSPSFGCGSDFSLNSFHLSTEFDCDLEFHYDMPDGSSCKHRSPCSKGGNTVKNSQCGGARNVTIVYPTGQKNKPKPSCSVTVTSIDFDCSTRTKSTKTKSTKTTPATTPATSTPATTTSSKPEVSTTPTTPAETTPTTPATTPTTPATTPTTPATTPTTPATTPSDSSETKPVESTPSTPATTPTTPVTTPGESTTTEITSSIITTEYVTTSTVFTTSVSTIISCSSNVPNCPGSSSTAIVTVTIPVSTTICPVTETQTVPVTKTHTKPIEETTSNKPIGSTTVPTTTTTSQAPIETLPCPDVVPSCLNTWLFTLQHCQDNTDSSCYCPDADFVKNVFDCIYAHGASDEIIEESIEYFQGICAKHAPSNPAIITGPTCTSYLTVTKTAAAVTVPVVTVVVSATTVVPCTDSAGAVITGSSSTVVINTSVTVPKVDFTTTGTGSDVVLVPGTATVPPVATNPGSGYSATKPAATTGGAAATGTGAVKPGSSSGVPVVVNAGGRVQLGAAAGFAGLVGMVVAAAL